MLHESLESKQASLPDLLVTISRQIGATWTFIEDPASLEVTGGAAALLRWRA
jgi:hypothetical protein